MGGYDYTDPITGLDEGDVSSNEDCIPIVYDRCEANNETRSASGTCVAIDNCTSACNGGTGTRSTTLGICTCDNTLPVDTVCNQNCRTTATTMTVTSGSTVNLTTGNTTSTLDLTQLGDVYGDFNCTSC
jgi:hypothetical protein